MMQRVDTYVVEDCLPESGNFDVDAFGKNCGDKMFCSESKDNGGHSVSNTDIRRKYRSYTMNDRLKAISMSESGMGSIAIGREMNIDSSLIRGWIRRYKKDGLDGLRPRSNRKYLACQQRCLNIARPQAGNQESSALKGYVNYVDNPVIVRSMVNALSLFGVHSDNIVVGNDVLEFSRTMSSGETLVLNSLFDLSSDFSRMLCIMGELLQAGITIVSINDSGQAIRPGEINSIGMVSLLKNYLSSAWNGIKLHGTDENRQSCKDYHVTVKQAKEETFARARMLYEEGYTMAHAARTAGCSYNSFRYWYSNRKFENR